MIAYKYVVKRLNQYYPLINYGIDRKIRNCPRYQLGDTYNNPQDFNTIKTELGGGIGYHFFKMIKPMGYYKPSKNDDVIKRFEKHIYKITKKRISLTCLKCEVTEIIAENTQRIVAKKFIIIQEINNKWR